MSNEKILQTFNSYFFEILDFGKQLKGPLKNIKRKDLFVLVYIYKCCPEHRITVTQLADLLRVSAAAVSQTVNGYEKKGWVTRVRELTDRRTVYIQITEETLGSLRDEWNEEQTRLNDFLDWLGEEDAENLPLYFCL